MIALSTPRGVNGCPAGCFVRAVAVAAPNCGRADAIRGEWAYIAAPGRLRCFMVVPSPSVASCQPSEPTHSPATASDANEPADPHTHTAAANHSPYPPGPTPHAAIPPAESSGTKAKSRTPRPGPAHEPLQSLSKPTYNRPFPTRTQKDHTLADALPYLPNWVVIATLRPVRHSDSGHLETLRWDDEGEGAGPMLIHEARAAHAAGLILMAQRRGPDGRLELVVKSARPPQPPTAAMPGITKPPRHHGRSILRTLGRA